MRLNRKGCCLQTKVEADIILVVSSEAVTFQRMLAVGALGIFAAAAVTLAVLVVEHGQRGAAFVACQA